MALSHWYRTDILHETPLGYITLEKTGKSKSYVIWIYEGTGAIRRHTLGEKIPNAFKRAKDKLDEKALLKRLKAMPEHSEPKP